MAGFSSPDILPTGSGTVAILAQGTSRADAATQAFFRGSTPTRDASQHHGAEARRASAIPTQNRSNAITTTDQTGLRQSRV